ncbi:MAG: CHAT domain-containing protein [Anaerolineales bacterium]|nr:CHAT domain-containing protein [Anaerolineales bacterium]
MEPTSVFFLRALRQVWNELPALLGSEWAQLFPQLEALLDHLEHVQSTAEKEVLVAQLMLLLRNDPRARERLLAIVKNMQREAAHGDDGNARGAGDNEIPLLQNEWTDALCSLQGLINAPLVTRYTDVTAPRQLAIGQRGVITMRLTRVPQTDSLDASPLEITPGLPVEVYLQARPQDFEVIGERLQQLTVEPEADTPSLVFYVKALSLGAKHLALDFHQAGVVVGTLVLAIEVVGDPLPEERVQSLLEVVQLGGRYAPPPDLEIRVVVREQDGRTVLSYTIHSPNGTAGFHYQPAGETVFHGSPETYRQHIMAKMEALSLGHDVDKQSLNPQQIEDKLDAIGHELYEQIFSPEMRSAYHRWRASVHTILITSDEPWIPWELIKPYDDSDPDAVLDDEFLCIQFQVTRWLAGRGGGAGKIEVSRIACVQADQVPGHLDLPHAHSESQYFSRLASAFPNLEDVSPSPATSEAVKALLDRGGISLWHFIAHSNIDLAAPDESVLLLADGYKFRPEDVHGQRQTHVAKDRPLVFMNACQVGQQGWSLTRLGGWAAIWVDRCRCGAFIGPLWSIDDRLADEFAHAFYDGLCEGHTIGQAVQSARRQAREQTLRCNPTWLAYSVYAHPNARVRLKP